VRSLSQFLLTKPVPILAVFWPVFRSMDSGLAFTVKRFSPFSGWFLRNKGLLFYAGFAAACPGFLGATAGLRPKRPGKNDREASGFFLMDRVFCSTIFIRKFKINISFFERQNLRWLILLSGSHF